MNIYMDPTYGLSIKLYEKWFGKILQNFLSSAVYESLPLQYSVPNQNECRVHEALPHSCVLKFWYKNCRKELEVLVDIHNSLCCCGLCICTVNWLACSFPFHHNLLTLLMRSFYILESS